MCSKLIDDHDLYMKKYEECPEMFEKIKVINMQELQTILDMSQAKQIKIVEGTLIHRVKELITRHDNINTTLTSWQGLTGNAESFILKYGIIILLFFISIVHIVMTRKIK